MSFFVHRRVHRPACTGFNHSAFALQSASGMSAGAQNASKRCAVSCEFSYSITYVSTQESAVKQPSILAHIHRSLGFRPRKDKGRVLQFSAAPAQSTSPYDSSILSVDAACEARLQSGTFDRHVSPLPCKVGAGTIHVN